MKFSVLVIVSCDYVYSKLFSCCSMLMSLLNGLDIYALNRYAPLSADVIVYES